MEPSLAAPAGGVMAAPTRPADMPQQPPYPSWLQGLATSSLVRPPPADAEQHQVRVTSPRWQPSQCLPRQAPAASERSTS